MKIALVDDSQEARSQLEQLISEYSSANRLDLTAESFSDPLPLISSYSPYQYAAIFLDIYMDSMSGLDAAAEIRKADRNIAIIFLTSSAEHRPDAFRFHAFDYLTKPVDRSRLFGMLDDLFHRQDETELNRFTFTENRVQYSLPITDIVSVQSSAHYVEITDINGKKHRPRMNFSEASDALSEYDCFLNLMRGILVNMDHVTGFSGDTCILSTGVRLPVSTRRGSELESIWRNYKFTKIREDALRRNR
ncbi:MAG: response regulator transcription factor [Oscillospiraceae bacterium]|nr:response regulator transcription factor [Oscillospiraceae bacterium]